jgi:hypothetical protein
MDSIYPRLIGAVLFYVLTYLLYSYAGGKLWAKNSDNHRHWVETHGARIRKSVLIIVCIYTGAQLLTLFG